MSAVVDVLANYETRLVLLNPAHEVAAFIVDFREFDLEKTLFEQGTMTITLHKDSPACTASYSGEVALETNYGWTGTNGYWRILYYRRGVLTFDGIPIVIKKQHDNNVGEAYVTITCRATPWELLRRRQVRTVDGQKWQVDLQTWKNIARQLTYENCETGSLVTPTGYQQDSETRDDFKNFLITCPSISGSGADEYETEDRTNLALTLIEIFTTDESTAEWLWPTFTESPAGTYDIDFLVGRTGGSRGIGSALEGTMIFSDTRGNMLRFQEEADGTPVANQWCVAGKGIGTSQILQHVHDATSSGDLGVLEDGVTLSQAGTAAYLLREGQRKINEEKAPWQTLEVGIVETAGMLWQVNFDITDTAGFYSSIYGVSKDMMIIGVKEHFSSPGESTLTLIFGKIQRSQSRDSARQGGGGRGGGGGGGRTGRKEGTPETDPDAHKEWSAWRSQEGSDMLADELNDVGGAVGENDHSVIFNTTKGLDPGAGSGSEEKQMIYISGEYTADDVAVSGYVLIRLTDGNVAKLAAEYVMLGAPSAVPAVYGST